MSVEILEKHPRGTLGLDEYRDLDPHDDPTEDGYRLGKELASVLGTRRVWILTSAEHADTSVELTPALCGLLGDVGIDARWLVVRSLEPEFLEAVAALDAGLAGAGSESLEEHRTALDTFADEAVEALAGHVEPDDLLVAQGVALLPLGARFDSMGSDGHSGLRLWVSGTGCPEDDDCREAWSFARPYLDGWSRALFSERRLAPDSLKDRVAVLTPGIDPLGHKNRFLRPYKLLGILASAGLLARPSIPEWATFEGRTKVLRENSWREEPIPQLLHRPLVVQTGRFGRSRGQDHVLQGFYRLLDTYEHLIPKVQVDGQRLTAEVENLQLVIAGPDPAELPEEPEAEDHLNELQRQHSALPPDVSRRIHILRLPVTPQKEYLLVVNALQRLSTVVAHLTDQEGPALELAEAMVKGAPILTSRAGGIPQVARNGIDAILLDDPADADAVASGLLELLGDRHASDSMGRSAQQRVKRSFLLLHRLRDLLATLVEASREDAKPARHLRAVEDPEDDKVAESA